MYRLLKSSLLVITLLLPSSVLAEPKMNLWLLRVRNGEELPIPEANRIGNGLQEFKIGNWECRVTPTDIDDVLEIRLLVCTYKSGVRIVARVACSRLKEDFNEANLALVKPLGGIEGGVVLACSHMVIAP